MWVCECVSHESHMCVCVCVCVFMSTGDVVNSKGAFKLALPRGASHEDFIRIESEHYPNAKFNIEWTDTWEEA